MFTKEDTERLLNGRFDFDHADILSFRSAYDAFCSNKHICDRDEYDFYLSVVDWFSSGYCYFSDWLNFCY